MSAMSSPKTVALDREAYELLRRQKREGESFSDVVKRLARPFVGLTDLAGAWKDYPEDRWRDCQSWRKEVDAIDEKRHERLMRRMLGTTRKRKCP